MTVIATAAAATTAIATATATAAATTTAVATATATAAATTTAIATATPPEMWNKKLALIQAGCVSVSVFVCFCVFCF